MSSFTTPLVVEILDDYKYKLAEQFTYYSEGTYFLVPHGFVTDFASVPRLAWSILPPHGRYAKASVLHDNFYATGKVPRKEADRIFLEAMLVLGVNKRTAKLIYYAVRWFGKSRYRGKDNA